MKRLIGVIVLAVVVAVLSVAAQSGYSLSGRLTASDQEAQEGYFAVDGQTMIVVKPNSPMHTYLKSKVGQQVRLTIAPAADSE